jgi:predicted PurR-regulated permease PerM
VVIIVVPLFFIAIQLGKQLSSLIRTAMAYLDANPELPMVQVEGIAQLLKELSFGVLDLSPESLRRQIIEALSGGANAMVHMTTSIVRNVGVFFLNLLFMIFSLFFFYVDGEYLIKLFVNAVPIRNEYAIQLIQKFRDITKNLFLGYFLVSGVQGVAAYIIFLIFKIEGALAFSILLMFCSFIPMIGAGAVWLPLGVVRMLSGDIAGGILFLVLCAFFVSTLDNFLRPFFLKDRIHLHPLMIFFSILGGATVFGFNGLVVGPMIVIFFLTVLDLFLIEHGIDRQR